MNDVTSRWEVQDYACSLLRECAAASPLLSLFAPRDCPDSHLGWEASWEDGEWRPSLDIGDYHLPAPGRSVFCWSAPGRHDERVPLGPSPTPDEVRGAVAYLVGRHVFHMEAACREALRRGYFRPAGAEAGQHSLTCLLLRPRHTRRSGLTNPFKCSPQEVSLLVGPPLFDRHYPGYREAVDVVNARRREGGLPRLLLDERAPEGDVCIAVRSGEHPPGEYRLIANVNNSQMAGGLVARLLRPLGEEYSVFVGHRGGPVLYRPGRVCLVEVD